MCSFPACLLNSTPLDTLSQRPRHASDGRLILSTNFRVQQNDTIIPETPDASPTPPAVLTSEPKSYIPQVFESTIDAAAVPNKAHIAPIPSEFSGSPTPEWDATQAPSKGKGRLVEENTHSEGESTSAASSSTLSSSAETTGWGYAPRPKRVSGK